MKPTADQVIEEYEALPPEGKRKVYVRITEQSNDVSIAETNALEDFQKSTEQLPGTSTVIAQKVLWKDILIGFIPNAYISTCTEIWLLESILGVVAVKDDLSKHRVLDADFVERLFQQATYSFYLNQADTYLFSDYAELSSSEGGPLKRLTAIEALQRFGLKLLEEAKEKQYVRLR